MEAMHRKATQWLTGIIATCLAYPFVPTSPRYYPLEHLWRWANMAGAPSMGWYAKAGWALACGAACAWLAGFLHARLGERQANAMQRLLTMAFVVAFPASVAWLGVQEFFLKKH